MVVRKTFPASFLSLALVSLAAAGCATVVRPDGGKGLLPVGAPAPDVTGLDVHKVSVPLSAARGHAAVVYFYPADGTPGCTTEACAFRDAWTKYVDAHVTVIGVSTNSAEDHQKFLVDKQLPFALAADPDRNVAEAYGVGKGVFGDNRVTFLVDASGKVAKVWPDVDPGVHADEVLAAVKALPAN
jgi:peroxiredoxin Q/BCP